MTTKSAPLANSLKALTSSTEGLHRTDSFRVDPTLIQFEEGFNLRLETPELQEHIERLYQAMKAGAMMPAVDVSVVDGVIIARDGHCRVEAACRLKKEVPEFTLECRQFRGNDADAVVHMLGTGTGGKALSPLEQGMGFLRLIKFGLSATGIAKKLGVTRNTVDNGLVLAEAPAEVQAMIQQGEVSATTAREAVQQGTEGVQALTTAVEEQRKAPAKKKNGKKKKVTAKTLKGTKADKKAKKKKGKKKVTVEVHPGKTLEVIPVETPATDPNSVSITITKEVATAVFEYIRDFGGTGNPALETMKITLETALL